LLASPQHVALRVGERRLSPVDEIGRYVEVSRRYLISRAAALWWVASGLVTEAAFTVAPCTLATLLGWRSVVFWAAVLSLAMYLINVLLMDVPWAMVRRPAFGDTRGLWGVAKLRRSR
jgi:hypothetical protein